MSDIVVRVEDLSKRYTISHLPGRNSGGDGLRHMLQSAASAPWRALRNYTRLGHTPAPQPSSVNEDFYALQGVSFEVKRGEVLGVIGRNGAGKSTLLKILSRITEPSAGRVGIKGRVASLLEVGTGFHPDLTGRENIYLNGAILGMTRVEVKRKFDEIVDFSGVEKFLDTPVKRYSSGMYVRLAFAVAAHLEPEILVVDEVLAVGDAEFQKKCLGKMKEVAQGLGRTVFFVSHNLGAVESLCDTALHLEKGRVVNLATTPVVLKEFRHGLNGTSSLSTPDERPRRTGATYWMKAIKPRAESFEPREELQFQVEIESSLDAAKCHFSMHIMDHSNTNVTTISTEYLDGSWIHPGRRSAVVAIRSPWLLPGVYRVNAFLYAGDILDRWDDACTFEVRSNVANHGYSLSSSRNAGQSLCDFRFSEGSS